MGREKTKGTRGIMGRREEFPSVLLVLDSFLSSFLLQFSSKTTGNKSDISVDIGNKLSSLSDRSFRRSSFLLYKKGCNLNFLIDLSV